MLIITTTLQNEYYHCSRFLGKGAGLGKVIQTSSNITNIIKQVIEDMGPSCLTLESQLLTSTSVILAMLPDCTYKYVSLPRAMLLGGMIAGERNEIPLHVCSFTVSFVAPPLRVEDYFLSLMIWLCDLPGQLESGGNDNPEPRFSELAFDLSWLSDGKWDIRRKARMVPRYVRMPKDLRSAKPPKSACLQVWMPEWAS